MHCFECKKGGRSEEAVGLCKTCQVGLCLTHLREANSYVSAMGWHSCPHGADYRTPRAAAPEVARSA
jgi:hypothetical protein